MPALKNVLPLLMTDARFRGSEAYQLRDQQVTAIKRTTGAPCSFHSDLFAPWPGPEETVVEWYLLDNGYAVGRGTDRDGYEIYPVTRSKSN